MLPTDRSGGSQRGRPEAAALRWAAAGGVACLGISFGALYAVFLPLSYAAPAFVQWWLIENPVVFIWTRGESYLLANGVSLLTVALLAPFVEEVLFRGLLLRAWAARFGAKRAIIWSSLVFAVCHADIAGSFIFAVVVATVCVKSGGVWLPIVIHVTNNTIAWLLSAGSLIVFGESAPTLADFQTSWWLGVAGLVLGATLLAAALRHPAGILSIGDECARSPVSATVNG